ncbi:hypothetical protein D4764_06G0008170 [Takifugu flavidus]|uniref:Reverse transcriptase domain-containing protein n=1 Tax=Takifugu flavidus TaxID=433684 RepID=A0A5C6N0X9_9TELE|nr:hypothetical protein D4764_06G0008170 [Takifugu flavidus]
MSRAQKGIGNNTRGAKDQLLVDRAITQDCRTRHTNLCTAWTDYKKAYESMLHTWILECLKLYNLNRTLREFIQNSMKLVTLEANSKPIARIITKSGYGCQLRSGTTISHLLYMDDIKLYAKNERDTDCLIHSLSLTFYRLFLH